MSNVLFVKANNRPSEQSVSVQMYETFFNSYKEAHPDDQITELNLFEAELPYYDVDMMTGLYKQSNGYEPTAQEKQAADLANRYLEQFLAADKVVFAFPLWNFTIPAQLLTYLFYITQSGKTFSYSAEGPVGLAGDKKVVLLNARGGIYSEGPAASIEMSLNYLKTMMGFIGIKQPEVVVIEGHNQFRDRAQEIVEAGLKKTAQVAASF
ncbi:FMN-dependent NADH-azoreductase [Paenibacillus cremeus]|uniref:FMN dependent NADH:quinone oxidoreductase n=1 Tax=Paenibacillus cremeus TaxID=2163881 RepID=A0A559JK82_9BACL|nr:FMN-dependent NADH-azoreductase [Paenibacillus cremeus]TVY00283.1 FMN-dependent NADH-azoreductase [Paenibacillus cremeus]